MCCYRNVAAGKRLLKRFGKRQTLQLWKVLEADGRACLADYRYRPGVNVSDFTGSYTLRYPRGIHVYVSKEKDLYGGSWPRQVLVTVICHRDDFIRAASDQAVFSKVTILKKDWEAAGLPVRKGKR